MKNQAAAALARLRTGIKERPSERKRASCARNLELARAGKAKLRAAKQPA